MKMETKTQIQQKKYKETDPNLFFKVNIKGIKDDLLLSIVSGCELKILLAIASCINKSGSAYPSQKYLSRVTSLSISTISRIVRSLSSKEFKGEKILSIEKRRERGNKFTNNRYYLSTKLGISFGSNTSSSKSQNSIKQLDQTNYTNTKNENQILKKNNEVSSFKKKAHYSNPGSVQAPDLKTLRKDESFNSYAKAISAQKPFNGNLLYAERAFRKNIEIIGYENWLDLVKKLKYHPTPQDLLDHVRYKTSQEEMTYKEAMDDWDKQF